MRAGGQNQCSQLYENGPAERQQEFSMERRVVITACSAITPIGRTKEEILHNLVHGISGVKALREDGLLSSYIHSKVFGTVDYPIEYDFKRQHRKTMGPVAYYACQVAKEVLESCRSGSGLYHIRPAGCRLRFDPRESHRAAGYLQDFFRRHRETSFLPSALSII